MNILSGISSRPLSVAMIVVCRRKDHDQRTAIFWNMEREVVGLMILGERQTVTKESSKSVRLRDTRAPFYEHLSDVCGFCDCLVVDEVWKLKNCL